MGRKEGSFSLTVDSENEKENAGFTHFLRCFLHHPHMHIPHPRLQVNPMYWSELLAAELEAGLKFTIINNGGPFVMMAGKMLMPPCSAACWVSLLEGPLPVTEEVSDSPASASQTPCRPDVPLG